MDIISQRIAEELEVNKSQVISAIALLDQGSTVPFIARYRKEITGGLDDTQLRNLEQRLGYLRELNIRRETILASIKEQNKLTAALQTSIKQAQTRTHLEDLYLPYKPRRTTKAMLAHEAGLTELAESLLANPSLVPQEEAQNYLNPEKNITDSNQALEGARYILMEKMSEHAELLAHLRQLFWDEGVLSSTLIENKEIEGEKFKDYFSYSEPMNKIPSHRALALFRGRQAGILRIALNLTTEPENNKEHIHPCQSIIAKYWNINKTDKPADNWLQEVVLHTWRIRLSTQIETALMNRLREEAEEEAIQVFAKNLKDLLLAAPAGLRPSIGLDPGLRTGVKVAVIDGTGKLMEHQTIFPHVPQKKWKEALGILATLCLSYQIELISIGNGTGSRETDRLVSELMRCYPKLKLKRIIVSEAGASVYSASELAAQEFPNLDVSFRGAVSIARRLQDPLAELVKIDPKSIGVGQYQHDVSQVQLSITLDKVVEDCVNNVGVDLNTASAPLLSRISGLNKRIAANIIDFRDKHGVFKTRQALQKVVSLGPKAFEQAAGFLRITNGSNPLDYSAVHPEAYALVEKIAHHYSKSLQDMIGDSLFLKSIDPHDFVDDQFGVPTIKDILLELDKPGRDPRPEFKTAHLKEGTENIRHLKPNMQLEGSITNITNFGAFVDIGVHQDGLVHISALSENFIKSPHDIVKTGDIVKVKVIEVDIARKRISLSMLLSDQAASSIKKGSLSTKKKMQEKQNIPINKKTYKQKPSVEKNKAGTFATLFANAKKIRR